MILLETKIMKKLNNHSTLKIIIIGLMVSICTLTTYYFHFILKTEVIFTHLFYIPIILASLWWSRKGAVVGLFLALMLVISNLMNPEMPYIWSNVVRGIMFIFVGYLVDALNLRNLILIDSLNRIQDYQNKLINYSNAPIVVWDPDFTISRVNQAFEYITGYSADEIIGKDICILFSDATQKESLKKIEGALNSEYIEAVEVPFNCKDGATRLMLCNLANVYEEDGKNVMSTIAQCTDITERRRAVEELRKEKEFSEKLVQTAPTFFVAINSKGKTIMMNNSMLQALGYTPEEVIGTDYMKNYIPESDHPMFLKIFDDLVNLKEPTLSENRVLTKNGKEILVEWHGRPIFKENGELDFFFGIGINITELKRAEEELRAAHQKLMDIIEFLPDATFVIDTEKKVIAWNRAIEEMTGVKKQEILGKDDYAYAVPFYKERRPILIDLIHDFDSVFKKKYNFVEKRGNTLLAETFVPHVYEGKGAYLWVVASPLFDSSGNQIGAIESIRNITERKRAEDNLKKYAEKLEHSNELKDLFTDILSHDLLNPAGIVKGYTEILLDLEDQEEKLKSLHAIERNNERLIDMIESAAKFAKLESVEQLEFIDMDIGIIFKKVVEDFRPNLDKKQMVLEFAAGGTYLANVNPVIEEVFSNLLSNAIKYSPEGSRIIVDILDDDDKWKVMVTDFGIGIPDNYKPRLFERFKRLERKGVKGTGLGLAIVKRIVSLHNGSFGVEDNPVGQGSVFWVTLKKTS